MIRLKRNKHDLIVIILSVLIIAFLSLNTLFSDSSENKRVNVYYHDEIIWTWNLEEDKLFTMNKKDYKDLKGDLVVEIKNGRVRIAEETSKNNICSLQSWESRAGRPLVCLPNYVMVIIEGYEVTDTDFEM